MRAVNLLPRELDQGKKSPAAPLIAGCVGLVLATGILAGGYLSASGKVGKQNAEVAALNVELAAVPKPAVPPASLTALPQERQARVTALASALSTRIAWDRLLREISLVLPDDVWLSGLTAKSPVAPTPGALPVAPGTAVDLSGFSLQGFTYSQEGVARLLSRLEVIPDLDQVSLLTSTQAKIGARTIYQFSIGGAVRQPGAVPTS
jgi:Tfp pilus assembly protein PilN